MIAAEALRLGDPHLRRLAVLQQLPVFRVGVEDRHPVGSGARLLCGRGLFGGRDLVLQPDDFRVLVGEGELGVGELAAQRQHPRLGVLGRGAAGGGDRLVGALLHALDLTLDHRQPILLAAGRGRRRLELALRGGHHREIRVGLFRQPAHERFLHVAEPLFEAVQAGLAGAQLCLDEL